MKIVVNRKPKIYLRSNHNHQIWFNQIREISQKFELSSHPIHLVTFLERLFKNDGEKNNDNNCCDDATHNLPHILGVLLNCSGII